MIECTINVFQKDVLNERIQFIREIYAVVRPS
jgi:hypothetical protein